MPRSEPVRASGVTSDVQSKRRWTRDRSALAARRRGRRGPGSRARRLRHADAGRQHRRAPTSATAAAAGPGPGVTDDSVKVVFVAVDLDAVKKTHRLQHRLGRRPGGAGPGPRGLGQRPRWPRRQEAGRRLPAVRRAEGLAGRRGAAVQPDHPGRQGVRGRDDRAVPDQRPPLLRRAPDPGPRRLALRDEHGLLRPVLAVPLDRELPGVRRVRARRTSRCSPEQKFFDGEDSVGVVAADSPLNRETIDNLAVPLLKDAGVEPEVALGRHDRHRHALRGADPGGGDLPQQGHRPGDVPRWVPARQRLRERRGDAGRLRAALRDLELRQPDVLRQQPPDHPGRDHGRDGRHRLPPAAGRAGRASSRSRPARPRRSASRSTPTPASASSPGSRRGWRCPTATPPGCSSSAPTGWATDASFNAAAWAQAVDRDGGTFQTASGFGNRLGDGGRAATGAYRVLRYDEAKGHFVYEGPEVPFDDE